MFRLGLCAAVILFAGPTYASPINEHLEKVSTLSEAQCRALEREYRDLYRGNDSKIDKTLSFVAEGTRLLCEGLRIGSEATRLQAEQTRLRSEAARLEEAWQRAHQADPVKFPDFDGRDKSQDRLLSDATELDRTLSVLQNVQRDLQREARRILNLAADEFELLDEPRSKVLLASLDDEDSHDVIIRLLKRRGGSSLS